MLGLFSNQRLIFKSISFENGLFRVYASGGSILQINPHSSSKNIHTIISATTGKNQFDQKSHPAVHLG